MLAEVNGELAIVDYKTSKPPKDGNMYESWTLQLAAYAIALEEELGQEIKRHIILRLPKTPEHGFGHYEETDIPWAKEGYLRALSFYRWQKGIRNV